MFESSDRGKLSPWGWLAAGALALVPVIAAPKAVWAQEQPPADAQTPDRAEEGGEVSASDLKAAIDSIKERLAKKQENRPSSTGELAAELRSARETITQLTESMSRLRGERDRMLSELRTVQEESAERAQAVARVERALEQAREEARVTAEALEQELTAQAQATGEAQGDAQQLRQQLENSLSEIDELTSTVQQAWADRDRLEEALAQARSQATAEVSTRDEALQSMQAQLGELEEELVRRSQREQQTSGELTAVREDLAAATEALEGVRAENAATTEELARTAERLAEEREALEGARAEVAGLKENVREVRQQADARLQERTNMLTGNLDEAEARIAALETELGDLRAVASTSVAEVQSLGEELLLALSENEELLAALGEVRASREILQSELAAARSDSELYASEASRLRGGASENEQLEAMREVMREAQTEIEELTAALANRDEETARAAASGDLDALSRQVQLLEGQLREAEVARARLEEELSQLRTEESAQAQDEGGQAANVALDAPN